MDCQHFLAELDSRIRQYDLLCHSFYKAWSAGTLTRDDLRAYAQQYYAHVEAFPTYLAEFGIRLEDGELRRAVLANLWDEKGGEDAHGEPTRRTPICGWISCKGWVACVPGVSTRRSGK